MSGLSRHNHICGCYYIVDHERQYLPQVALDSRTIIHPISFSTQLRQTFSNPNVESLEKVRYAFPLYDGVAVSGYTIAYGGKTLRGVVRQKDDAKQIYRVAVERGDTAGLLEALPAGVFGVTLGNVPPSQDITVTIDYCGELKHDSQIDGLRFNLPTSIAPRYGSYPGKLLNSNARTKRTMRITVDIDMLGSPIRKVQSPSHPLAVTMGAMSNAAEASGKTAPFASCQASATLTLGSAELAEDFVLQLLVDNVGNPKAVIETHPHLPNQRVIMATLVPKFMLEQASPEIVFVADQSGSMQGERNQALVAALKIFLKSLPLGVRFNICAFGSRFQFLWPKSVPYSEDNFDTAVEFVNTFDASYGGTELLEPIRQTFERQLKDLSLEIMLLTDGQIRDEAEVFDFINGQIRNKGVDARVFALGIGEQVSHTLIEGVARAGNGFAQFTQTESEEIDQKVIRMLKGALFAHTKDYTLRVHYESSDTAPLDECDFEIIDKASDYPNLSDQALEDPQPPAKPKSFFDSSADLDGDIKAPGRYTHLPNLQIPAVIQAPASIPPLFPFNRTNVYLLLGPDSPQSTVTSVTLRATSSEGPLELNIPVDLIGSGTSIHQLAARKAIQDLEEGRGWLHSANVKTAGGDAMVSVKEKYESRFGEIVEREAVRLGETFCVAAKFTSFVAVSDRASDELEEDGPQAAPGPDFRHMAGNKSARRARLAVPLEFGEMRARRCLDFDTAKASEAYVPKANMQPPPPPMQPGGNALMACRASAPLMKMSSAAARSSAPSSGAIFEPADYLASLGSSYRAAISEPLGSPHRATIAQPMGTSIHQIISLQTFAGAWIWGDELLHLIGKQQSEIDIAKLGNNKNVAATVLVVAFMETTLAMRKEVWELVVGKARVWLGKQMGGDADRVEALIREAAEGFDST